MGIVHHKKGSRRITYLVIDNAAFSLRFEWRNIIPQGAGT
jgi:hypothetical protein